MRKDIYERSFRAIGLGVFVVLILLVGGSVYLKAKPAVFWSFAVIGDTRNGLKTFNKLLDIMLKDPYRPEMLFHTGDMVNRGANIGEWEKYKNAIAKLAGRIRVFPVVGNHEMFRDKKLVNYIKEARPPGGNLYYAFSYRNTGFVVLNAYMPGNVSKIDTRQLEWLKDTLGKMRPKVRTIFAFLHHPLLTRKTYRHPDALINAKKVLAELRAAKVTAVFVGHEHRYDHLNRDGIHQFVSAGGGASLYGKHGGAFYHYCRVIIEPQHVRVVAIDVNGEERAEVVIPISPAQPIR